MAGSYGSEPLISRTDGGWQFFSSPQHPDWFWGPSSLLSNAYQGFFPWR